jgi:SAM-dependent methyltransferase
MNTPRSAGQAPSSSGGVFSCVVEDDPGSHLDVLRWFASLTRLAGVSASQLVVWTVGDRSSEVLQHLSGSGVIVRKMDEFELLFPGYDRIAGAARLAEMGVDGVAVLSSTDVAILEDPRAVAIPRGWVGARLVDAPKPPIGVLTSVFDAAAVRLPRQLACSGGSGESTIEGNCDDGLYLVPGSVLGPVTLAWDRWARWLAERVELLGQWAPLISQVAMALALAAGDVRPFALERRWNTSTSGIPIPEDADPPAVIRYHQGLTRDGRVERTGSPSLDLQLDRLNEVITSLWHEAFPNATFWEWRYLTNPELGSGVGSRGDSLRRKRALLESLLQSVRPASVLDVGCGDGQATQGLPIPRYIGIDLSAEAVRLATAGRPDGEFLVGSLADRDVEADLTLCLDVLIHQADAESYRDLVATLWASTGKVLVVSGYDSPLGREAAMVHFHEPLSSTLDAVAPGAERLALRVEDGVTTFAVQRPGVGVSSLRPTPQPGQ